MVTGGEAIDHQRSTLIKKLCREKLEQVERGFVIKFSKTNSNVFMGTYVLIRYRWHLIITIRKKLREKDKNSTKSSLCFQTSTQGQKSQK